MENRAFIVFRAGDREEVSKVVGSGNGIHHVTQASRLRVLAASRRQSRTPHAPGPRVNPQPGTAALLRRARENRPTCVHSTRPKAQLVQTKPRRSSPYLTD